MKKKQKKGALIPIKENESLDSESKSYENNEIDFNISKCCV